MKAEDRFVEKLRSILSRTEGVLLGPGDDAAVVSCESGELVVTTDLLVESVDFLPDAEPEEIGRRAVAVSLSDLAAMGARPRFFLLSIGFSRGRGEEFVLSVARGALSQAEAFGCALAGGDLSASPTTLVSVAIWGTPDGRPIRRSGARPGDLLYVSGFPGRAAAGLILARRLSAFASQGSKPIARFVGLTPEEERGLLAAYRDPHPRVALGRALAKEKLASAAIDLSDGLGVDTARLARASGVRAVIEERNLPVSQPLRSFCELETADLTGMMLSGGDDYELLFTVPPEAARQLQNPSVDWGAVVTCIGQIEEGSGAVIRSGRGEREIGGLGHDHFEP